MAIVYDKLMALRLPDAEVAYAARDVMLYALGVGLGQDPMDEDQLPFVYEKELKVLPTYASMIGYPGFWLRDLPTGVDWVKVLNGEYEVRLAGPLPAAATVVSRMRILDVIDKGADKGALIYTERTTHEKASGRLIATTLQTVFCRGDGGFGGPQRPARPVHPIPERAPDLVCDLGTRPETALIYRLSGDYNPLHAEPAIARAAGYPRPILHGLATFGISGHAVLKACCGYDPSRMAAIAGRFSAPVFPGETIRTEMWRDGAVVSFRARVVERDVIAINNGRVEIRE